MNRNQGIVAASIVFAGAMMRPMFQANPGDGKGPNPSPKPPAAATSAKGVTSEGPWKASCNYWKPSIPTQPDAATGNANNGATPTGAKSGSSLSISITGSGEAFDSHVTGSVETPDPACGPDGWGLHDTTQSSDKPSIKAIIALVPDPLRSSTPWEFDRSIEVLTQAAAQYGFVGSYFWLPWQQTPAGKNGADQTSEDSQKSAKDREKQPGLLILKQENTLPGNPYRFPPPPGSQTPAEASLLYLFLVGQSPAVGVNGEQLQNALRYESYLNRCYGFELSFKAHAPAVAKDCSASSSVLPSALDIIGPENSGAAASLRAALESLSGHIDIQVAGATSTQIAASAISNPQELSNRPTVRYVSFEDDVNLEQQEIKARFQSDHERLAFLTETGTIFALGEVQPKDFQQTCIDCALSIHFPRNISLLRNAEREDISGSDASAPAVAGPYMRLSLKDTSADDIIPPFSASLTPYSQEAQWMQIVRELTRNNVTTVVVSASNSLDELFLVKSLHRDVPDVRVVVYDGGDLLFARVGDDQAYIGTVTLGSYPLAGPAPVGSSLNLQGFADAQTEGVFNAAMYTFWDGSSLDNLHLAGYRPVNGLEIPPPLWATAVGRDGYSPLAILKECSNSKDATLTTKPTQYELKCVSDRPDEIQADVNDRFRTAPAFSWCLICLAVGLLCLAHALLLLAAEVTSSLTRDIAIRQNDQPRRRSVYIHIGAATLFCMSMITVIPIFATRKMVQTGPYTFAITLFTLLAGIFAAAATLRKTRGYWGPGGASNSMPDAESVTRRSMIGKNQENEAGFFPWFNFVAAAAAVLIPWLWWSLCSDTHPACPPFYTGLFFAYRCLYPVSGVSPLVPVLLILLTWYIWASVQTRRLRFSENSRPMMPAKSSDIRLNLAYVSDERLGDCSRSTDSCLYENIECLLITRQLVRRRFPRLERYLNAIVGVVYVSSFIGFLLFLRIEGLGNFLRPEIGARGWYEIIIGGLLFPLLVVAISGCTRMVMIWTSLSNGLLSPLERSPLRFAFSRLTNVGWMTMLRQGGLFEYWLDLARSLESMQQLVTLDQLWRKGDNSTCQPLTVAKDTLAKARHHIALLVAAIYRKGKEHESETRQSETQHTPDCFSACLQACVSATEDPKTDFSTEQNTNFLLGNDLPCPEKTTGSNSNRQDQKADGEGQNIDCEILNLMCAVEDDCARFADLLLHCVLAKYWFTERHCLVEAELRIATGYEAKTQDDTSKSESKSDDKSGKTPDQVKDVYLAEEYLAIRYVSLIRAVLINIRLLMTFISAAFVLALLAWNSYPFQPKQPVDWTFTIMLFVFGTLVVWVFAQMHRNPILSRITGTEANQLGADFFWRIIAYGAVPVLTWVGSAFPAVSSGISKLLQSGFAPGK